MSESGSVAHPEDPTRRPVFRLEDPRQARIYAQLAALVGLGPAAFYRDACMLLQPGLEMETMSHLVAHLLREVESAIRAVLEPIKSRSDKVAKECSNAPGHGHKSDISEILVSLEVDEGTSAAWLSLVGKLHELAHRISLSAPRVPDDEFRVFVSNMDAVLDNVLERLRNRYVAYYELLDGLLQKQVPTSQDIKTLMNNIPQNAVALGYFFSRLLSAEWLAPLDEAGYFSSPPSPQRNQDGTTAYPLWPAAEYLARMAKEKPEVVRDIIQRAPRTENYAVHIHYADAALAMPPKVSAGLLEQAKPWAESARFFVLAEKLGKLVSNLARGNQTATALGLAESLLSLTRRCGEEVNASPEAVAKFETYAYERILSEDIPDLVKHAGLPAFELLCRLLDDAVRYSRSVPGQDDVSDFGISSVSVDDADFSDDLLRLLVTAVRSTAELLCSEPAVGLKVVMAVLEQRDNRLYKRLTLHLLRRHLSADRERLSRYLGEKALFDRLSELPEYVALIKLGFEYADDSTKDTILKWIEAGPFIDNARYLDGSAPTDEELREYKQRWQHTHG